MPCVKFEFSKSPAEELLLNVVEQQERKRKLLLFRKSLINKFSNIWFIPGRRLWWSHFYRATL